MSEQDKKHWAAIKSDPVRYAAYLERKRRERAARPGYETSRKRNWRRANPDDAQRIRKANHAVENALLQGKLVRPEACAKCGAVGPVQGHHPSYEPQDWLRVLWLCVTCHAAEHHPRVGT